MAGPLAGVRVVELAGLGPAPFAGMVLSDLGAEVVRIDRRSEKVSQDAGPSLDLLGRNRRSVAVDLKHPEAVRTVLRLVEKSDALIEGFRPGVTERLGIGPDECLARNPRLVYGRVTGWGRDGPYAHTAGHDINYIALAGALHPIGRAGDRPVPPINLIGDFGGGGMLLAFGVVCALFEASRSGRGQVVDAAMVDGAALLLTQVFQLRAMGQWEDERGVNLLDGGAPYYDVYETKDGKYVSIGALEPQFYAEFVEKAGIDHARRTDVWDKSEWQALRERIGEVMRSKTRDEWAEVLEGSDACFAPVLSLGEAVDHPHNRFRNTFVEVEGVVQPAPAPRFSRTPGAIRRPPPRIGEGADEVLREWGFDDAELGELRRVGAIA